MGEARRRKQYLNSVQPRLTKVSQSSKSVLDGSWKTKDLTQEDLMHYYRVVPVHLAESLSLLVDGDQFDPDLFDPMTHELPYGMRCAWEYPHTQAWILTQSRSVAESDLPRYLNNAIKLVAIAQLQATIRRHDGLD